MFGYLCVKRIIMEEIYEQITLLLESNYFSEVDAAVIDLLVHYGLRISSILQISQKDIDRNVRILVAQGKRSSPIICIPVYSKNYWKKVKDFGVNQHNYRSRWYYYRLLRKLHFELLIDGHSNKSVTHLFRHNVVTSLSLNNTDDKIISRFTGHRNSNNLKFYKHEKKTI